MQVARCRTLRVWIWFGNTQVPLVSCGFWVFAKGGCTALPAQKVSTVNTQWLTTTVCLFVFFSLDGIYIRAHRLEQQAHCSATR